MYDILDSLDPDDDQMVNRVVFVRELKIDPELRNYMELPSVYIPSIDRTISLR